MEMKLSNQVADERKKHLKLGLSFLLQKCNKNATKIAHCNNLPYLQNNNIEMKLYNLSFKCDERKKH